MQKKPKTLKSRNGNVDLKDREVYPAPETHHDITCKICAKEARVLLRYTRSCDACRNTKNFRKRESEANWDTWGGDPSLGLPERTTYLWIPNKGGLFG